jgi:hypothetical protein
MVFKPGDAGIAMFYFWQVDEDARASRLPPPWSVQKLKERFVVKDGAGPKVRLFLLRG